VDLDAEETERAAAAIGGDRLLPLTADVTDYEAVERAVADTVGHFSGLDVAVANAGIAPQTRTMRSADPELFHSTSTSTASGTPCARRCRT
jgi:NAD(P)-dependent dehydrogenase (short-subunit alcohol dehydrogenase family)